MNKVFLIGNLTRDPELRQTPNGVAVCSFGIAVNKRFAGPDGQRGVEFFTISAWRQMGENCAKFLAKGRKVAVMGELSSRSYDGQDGSKRFVMEVTADEVQFLTPKDGQGFDGGNASFGANADGGMQPVADDNLPF